MKDRTTEATPATPEDRDGSEDVVYLVGATEDGEGMNALRSRGGEIEIAQIRALEEGESIVGSELVSLRPRELPFVCDVEVIHDARTESEPTHPGPVRVTSERYRRGWDAIFSESVPPRGDGPPN